MKKVILSLLSLIVGMSAMAQTTIYAAVETANSKVGEKKGVIYGFDSSNPNTITEVAFSEAEAFSYTLLHGILAGKTYYAVNNEETESGTNSIMVAYNCETQVKTTVCEAPSGLQGFAYDDDNNVLYALTKESTYDETTETTTYSFVLYTVDVVNGKFNKKTNVSLDTTLSTSAICYDGEGGIYIVKKAVHYKDDGSKDWWNYEFNLHRIDIATGSTALKEENIGLIKGTSYSQSLALKDNVLYYIDNTNLYTYNFADKTYTRLTNDILALPATSTGLCFEKSSEDPTVNPPVVPGGGDEANDTYKVKVVETWGDILGQDTGCTYKTFSYYNADNKLVRTAGYGKLLNENGDAVPDESATYQLERYTQYNYNELGQLTESWTEQYGVFDGEDLAYRESYDRINYTYDENGNLIHKDCVGEGCQYAYEYDAEGNLTREARLQLDAYDRDGDGDKTDYYDLWFITYSDFVNGKPTKAVCDGQFSNYQYNAVYTYDDKGRKIEEIQTNYSDVNTNKYVWTYEGDILVKYEEFKWKSTKTTDEDGNQVEIYDWKGTKYTEYTQEEGNPDRIKRVDWTWDEWATTPGWSTGSTYTVTENSEFDGVFAPELTIEMVADEINTAKLIITPPAVAQTQQVAFDIYRKGLVIGRVLSTDLAAYDNTTGTYFFVDENIPNGTYDYWVQTVLFDEIGETEEGKNVAIVQKQSFNVELPAVTEFEVTKVTHYDDAIYVDPYTGDTSTYSGNYATIEWKAPADAETMEKLGFVRYNVYQENMKAADNNAADGQALTWDFDFYENTSYNIYIQTVYKYGKSNSETKTLTINIEPKEIVYQLSAAQTDWSMDTFTKIEGEENKYELKYDEFTGEFKLYVDKDLFNCYTMGAYNPDIDENPFKINEDNLLVGPDTENPAMVIDNAYTDVTFTLTIDGDKLYLKMTGTDSGVEGINAENGLYNVYNYQGIRVLNNADKDAVNALPAGFYIVNGKKVVIR